MWLAINYVAVLLTIGTFAPTVMEPDTATKYVLFGFFPAALLGAASSWLHLQYQMHEVVNFKNPDPNIKIKKLHKCAAFHLGGGFDISWLNRILDTIYAHQPSVSNPLVYSALLIAVDFCQN